MKRNARTIEVCAGAGELASAAAARFIAWAEAAVAARGRFRVALSGGSTPNALYERLATADRDAVPWHAIHLFWGDERHVPPTHQDSNYRAAFDAMIGRVPLPPEQVHRIPAELPNAADAAAAYERTLQREFTLPPGELPVFDLVINGMGSDGHTASLFPGQAALRERGRLVLAPWVDTLHTYRITLSLPVLNRAAATMFLVSGRAKAETLRAVLEGPDRGDELPAQLIRPAGELVWLVDRAAASQLTVGPAKAGPHD